VGERKKEEEKRDENKMNVGAEGEGEESPTSF